MSGLARDEFSSGYYKKLSGYLNASRKLGLKTQNKADLFPELLSVLEFMQSKSSKEPYKSVFQKGLAEGRELDSRYPGFEEGKSLLLKGNFIKGLMVIRLRMYHETSKSEQGDIKFLMTIANLNYSIEESSRGYSRFLKKCNEKLVSKDHDLKIDEDFSRSLEFVDEIDNKVEILSELMSLYLYRNPVLKSISTSKMLFQANIAEAFKKVG